MKRFKVPAIPRIRLPRVQFTFSFPFRKTAIILGAINTFIFVALGSTGLLVSYINPVPYIAPYIPLHIATQLFDSVVFLQANLAFTIGISAGLIVVGLLFHAGNFKSWWNTIRATPMAVARTPVRFYKKVTIWRDWLIAKITYLNEESAKWKTAFNIAKFPFSLLRAMGFSPQMAVGILAVGSTAATGVVVNETILSERSFLNGDSGIYAAPSNVPSTSLEETMAWRKENKQDNTLRIVLGATPVREIRIENVSVGTVYSGSELPTVGNASSTTAILVGGVDLDTDTVLEIGELIIEKSRCKTMDFSNIDAHTIKVIGNAVDGISIVQTAGTSRMRAIGGGHHQADAMIVNGGTYDRIWIDAPTSAVNGKIGTLILSNLYTEGGACSFLRMKVGTLTIQLNEVGAGDGFDDKDFVIAGTVTSANWTVTDNVEVVIAEPTETLTNE